MSTFNSIVDILKSRYGNELEAEEFSWDSLSVIAVHKVIGNYKSGQRPLQINIEHLKNIFPILDVSPILDTWRIRLNAFLSFRNLIDLGWTSSDDFIWKVDKIEYRRNIQHGYNYLQIANSAGIALLTNLLNAGDFYVFCKKANSTDYYIFGMSSDLLPDVTNNTTFLNETLLNSRLGDKSTFVFEYSAKISTFSQPLQKILFGAPGTGKSHQIKALRKEFGAKEFKTVFHPDSDYSTFVGAYKPMMQGDNVRYAFVPQVFTKAYTYAWNNPEELVLLTIEEINRGNCAQIFGDLFQCLDRNASGMSEYAIDAEYDLAEYLKENLDNQAIINSVFEENYQAENVYSKIALPSNLLIYATMNTSDQSLFPMDSAFKRRWDWEYVPINYEKAAEMTIQLDETTTYNWGDFIKKINQKIYDITQSEDKQLGNYFVKTAENEAISLDVFRSKVMFYLWSEIFKEENDSDTIFKYSENDGHKTFTFNQLYNENVVELLKSFMEYNNVSPS